MAHPKRRYRRIERLAARNNAMTMLAERHLQLMTALSVHARGFSSLPTETKCDRVARSVAAVRQSVMEFWPGEDLAAIDYLWDSLKFRAARQLHPLLTVRQADRTRAEKTLSGKIPNRQMGYFYKAWLLACLQLLCEGGMIQKDAVLKVASRVRRSPETIQDWQKELEADNAPLRPEPAARHLQRLSFHVRLCHEHACLHQLSGEQMLKLLKTDPLVVYRLSLRAHHSPISAPHEPHIETLEADA